MSPTTTPPRTIALARYRLTARVLNALELPDFAGAMLRSVFGAALRNTTCTTQLPHCSGCPQASQCAYTHIFEAQPPANHSLQKFSNIPNAYVIEPPEPQASLRYAPGEMLQFGIVLTGEALNQLPLVLYAWHQALQKGLTHTRSRAQLVGADWIDAQGNAHPVWTNTNPNVVNAHAPVISYPPPAPAALSALKLHIHTPMRLQSQGQPLFVENLTPRIMVAALARRIALVMEFHARQTDWGDAVPDIVRLSEKLQDRRDLHWHDQKRYSSRQHQEMSLGGVLGHWTLLADPATLQHLWPWLWLGQWLHIGKNATMGMGAYTLV